MSERVSVTEVRNALRCPRIFALGRLEEKVVAFPVGSSCLGATFHRLVDKFAGSISAPPAEFCALTHKAPLDSIEASLARWVLAFLHEELKADHGYWTIPGEVDELAEALREFARHLAGRIFALGTEPQLALTQVLYSGERAIEAQWPEGPLIVGRMDAIFCDKQGLFEIIEYKLTDEANDPLDQAQAVLYQRIFRTVEGRDAQATILRFTPTLRETNLGVAAGDQVANSASNTEADGRLGSSPTKRASNRATRSVRDVPHGWSLRHTFSRTCGSPG
jgi:DNA segregation ATPase FtsK/SpoIIIE, S-DNA-T family